MTKQRSTISQSSRIEIQNYYDKARKLSVLVKDMNKPDNFTYVDLFDLSDIVDEFALLMKDYLTQKEMLIDE